MFMKATPLQRIQSASRWVKALFLAWIFLLPLLGVALTSWFPGPQALKFHVSLARPRPYLSYPYAQELEAIHYGCYLLAAVWFYRVLSSFEQGKIFHATVLTYLRRLALLLVGLGLLRGLPVLSHAFALFDSGHLLQVLLQAMFFLLHPQLFLGLGLLLVVLIMEQTSLIKEEQALTV
jgi:hypothetical protein